MRRADRLEQTREPGSPDQVIQFDDQISGEGIQGCVTIFLKLEERTR